MGNAPLDRDILFFFKGDVGQNRLPHYSRGVRQRLYKLSVENDWKGKHNVLIGGGDIGGDKSYSELLSRSKYCLVAPGEVLSLFHSRICAPVFVVK